MIRKRKRAAMAYGIMAAVLTVGAFAAAMAAFNTGRASVIAAAAVLAVLGAVTAVKADRADKRLELAMLMREGRI